MTVFVLSYNHRHGTDLSAYATEARATEAAAAICVQFIDERAYGSDLDAAEPIATRVKRLHAEGKFDACREAYLEENTDEALDIEELEVQL